MLVGPLTWTDQGDGTAYQVGVVSFGPSTEIGGCGSKGLPDVFTRVTSFKDWLCKVGLCNRADDTTGEIVTAYMNKCFNS